MAGRGRGATLPAWMTSGDVQLSSVAPTSVEENSDSARNEAADETKSAGSISSTNAGADGKPGYENQGYPKGLTDGPNISHVQQPSHPQMHTNPPLFPGPLDQSRGPVFLQPPMMMNQSLLQLPTNPRPLPGQHLPPPQANPFHIGVSPGLPQPPNFFGPRPVPVPYPMQHGSPFPGLLSNPPGQGMMNPQPTHNLHGVPQPHPNHPGMPPQMAMARGLPGMPPLGIPPSFPPHFPQPLPMNIGQQQFQPPPFSIQMSNAGQPQFQGQPRPGAQMPMIPPTVHQQQQNPPSYQAPQSSSISAPSSVGDPNNELSNWSEHDAQGRKYWYNRVTNLSTYDKPACLKTPEERSIEPCPWKEYSAPDGKKYYSNGTESRWVMPEEFRQWKERIDAIEKKKLNQTDKAQSSTAQSQATPVEDSDSQTSGAKTVDSEPAERNVVRPQASKREPPVQDEPKEEIVYASREDAREAFINLLIEKEVSSSLKFKETQTLCQIDVRWNALKSIGERKQTLAEYQSKKMKADKESKKLLARKARDAFFQMLAENTDIDAKSRWRDVEQLLQNDSRFKCVEESRDREDYFDDFVSELAKKDREDKTRMRDGALEIFLKALQSAEDNGTITRKSIWADTRDEISGLLTAPELVVLDDNDRRRAFQTFVSKLEADYKEKERSKRDDLLKDLTYKKKTFRAYLENLHKAGKIMPDSRWKDVKEEIEIAGEFQDLEATIKTLDQGQASARDSFEDYCSDLKDAYRVDKRLMLRLLGEDLGITGKDFSFDMMQLKLLEKVAGKPDPEDKSSNANSSSSSKPSNQEDEVAVSSLLSERSTIAEFIFDELKEKIIADLEEEQRKQRRREERFLELCEDYFYHSDHVGTPWEKAKVELSRHSAYDSLSKSDKKRIFARYMSELERKMEAKKKSMQSLRETVSDQNDVGSNSDRTDLETTENKNGSFTALQSINYSLNVKKSDEVEEGMIEDDSDHIGVEGAENPFRDVHGNVALGGSSAHVAIVQNSVEVVEFAGKVTDYLEAQEMKADHTPQIDIQPMATDHADEIEERISKRETRASTRKSSRHIEKEEKHHSKKSESKKRGRDNTADEDVSDAGSDSGKGKKSRKEKKQKKK